MNDPSPAVATASLAEPSSLPLAIEADSLCKTYTEGLIFRKTFDALKGISFSVNQGEIFGLLGPNGAGKTTFIKILLGIIRKTGGSAKMLGYPAGSRQGRKLVGYLPEHLRIPAHLTGNTALEVYGNLSNVPTRVIRQQRAELLELVGLADRARDSVKQYSKGMLQRLGLAQSLLHKPKLLVMDEPTDGLDPRARAEMREIIRRLQTRGVTIFLNSHLLQEVEMVCQRVAILNKGLVRYCGAVDQIGKFVNDLAVEEAKTNGHQTDSVATGNRVLISIQGDDADAINRCFENIQFNVKTKTGNQFDVEAAIEQQPDVDALIDRLRNENVSIVSLQRPRVSLEDAFLQIVD